MTAPKVSRYEHSKLQRETIEANKGGKLVQQLWYSAH